MSSPIKESTILTNGQDDDEMYVTKRSGEREIVSFDKILTRIKKIGNEANIKINYTTLVIKVIDQLYDGISTTQLDELSAEQCASLASTHPDYNVLAGRITVSNHHKNTSNSFVEVMNMLYNYTDKHDKQSPLVSKELYEVVNKYPDVFEQICEYDRDYLIDYFGFKTLDRAYLMKINRVTVERPQHMWLRVSIGIHGDNLGKVMETYENMSQKYFTHATPTLFNAGTPRPQLSSCFLLSMENDSIDGIYNTLRDCALISKWAGGIGLHIHNVRASGSHIRGTNGSSNGIVPMLKVFNNTAKYVDQGGGKRNGSFAIYLEPWHADVEMFLQMRKNHGDEELKARDLFYALWVPDLFMERVKTDDGKWTLFCPDECPGLSDVYGDDFVALYTKYEREGKGRKTMKARDLWFQILDAQMETGTPYLLYKDACNKKSNQKNIGTIKSSNLCVAPETQILTDKGHVEIQKMEGQNVNVWNGSEYSDVQIFKTGENQELIDVYTSDGCKLSCTKYHKFFIQNNYSKKSIELKEAKDLIPGDKLVKCNYPVIDGKEQMNYAYTHGFFCGDGTYSNNNMEHSRCKFKCLDGHYFCKRHIDFETANNIENLRNDENIDKVVCNGISYTKKPISYLYDEKKELLKHMEYRTKTEVGNRIVLQLPLDINEKYFVPMNATLHDKMEWFSGLCDADGCAVNNGNNQQLQVSSIHKEFLFETKLMLQTCGINPKISLMRKRPYSMLPDGKGGSKLYNTQPLYRLLITSMDLLSIIHVGFNPKRLQMNPLNLPARNANQFIKIEKIVDEGRISDTYCFTEPKNHSGIFNGMITSQCTEILEYSDDKESAVCNLASIALPTFVDQTQTPPVFNFEKLHEIAKIVTNNLNRIIDVNYYPTPKTERSNKRHRPIGIGVQGLADVFLMLNMAFTCEEAKTMNKNIFETIYHAALEESCDMAKADGAYETFEGSPASQGILQFDMWNVDPTNERYDWGALKDNIKTHGLRNSLLLAPMPTASTSQILGFNECIEPITSNIYSRRTIAGEFIMANKYLVNDLIRLDLWNDKIKNNIIANNGSVQQIEVIPQEIRDKYKTVWELPMRTLIDMAADRGAYICQSQSLNLWLEDPNYKMLTSMHFYSWSKGLKTGIYYLRRRARHQAQQFTIEPEKNNAQGTTYEDNDEICEMCSS
jgi:ribonucleoside-diphosphate reductase alpha chain